MLITLYKGEPVRTRARCGRYTTPGEASHGWRGPRKTEDGVVSGPWTRARWAVGAGHRDSRLEALGPSECSCTGAAPPPLPLPLSTFPPWGGCGAALGCAGVAGGQGPILPRCCTLVPESGTRQVGTHSVFVPGGASRSPLQLSDASVLHRKPFLQPCY